MGYRLRCACEGSGSWLRVWGLGRASPSMYVFFLGLGYGLRCARACVRSRRIGGVGLSNASMQKRYDHFHKYIYMYICTYTLRAN
jgi:hypothetical protein